MLMNIGKCWGNRSIRYSIMIIIAMLRLIVGMSFGAYVGSVLWIKKIGINVKPSKVHQSAQVQYYLQNDPL